MPRRCRPRPKAVSGSSDRRAAAMPPYRVRSPVAATSIRASPLTSVVPPNRAPEASAAVSASLGPARFSTGKGSPVSSASSARAARLSSTIPSAGTMSPARSSSTSPGTTSSAATSTRRPSRRTRDRMATERFSASAAASARCSCTTSMAIEAERTSRISTRLGQSPMLPDSTAAASRMATRGSASRRPTRTRMRRRGPSAARFGPQRRRRRAASADPSPAGLPSSTRKRSGWGRLQKRSGGSKEHADEPPTPGRSGSPRVRSKPGRTGSDGGRMAAGRFMVPDAIPGEPMR